MLFLFSGGGGEECFRRDFEETNTPVVIEGASLGWEAVKRWGGERGEAEHLLALVEGSTSPPLTFRATSGKCSLPVEFTLSTYLEYAKSTRGDESPFYFFDRDFAKKCPRLHEDYMQGLMASCPFFCPHEQSSR